MRFTMVAVVFGVLTSVVGCGRADVSDAGFFAAENSEEQYVIIGSVDTFLKISSESSSNMNSGSEKCAIPADKKLILQEQPSISDNHFVVKLSEPLADCSLTAGYIFRGHVAESSMRSLFSGNMQAFLDTIAFAEGTKERYDYIFSFATFSSFAGHPRRVICSGGYCSDAAGRYQIKSTTWDEVRRMLGLTDFSPESQDRAAVQLIKLRGGYDDVERISGFNSFDDALYAVRYEWASLPHSPYGQPLKSASTLWEKYKQFRERY